MLIDIYDIDVLDIVTALILYVFWSSNAYIEHPCLQVLVFTHKRPSVTVYTICILI